MLSFEGNCAQKLIVQLLDKFFSLKVEIPECKEQQCPKAVLPPKLVDGDITLTNMPEIIRHLGVKGKCQCMQGDDAQKAKIFEGLKCVDEIRENFVNCYLIIHNNPDKSPEEHKQMAAADKQKLHNSLLAWNKEYVGKKFFLGDEVSLVDCYTVSTFVFFYNKMFTSGMGASHTPDVIKMIGAFYEDFIAAKDVLGNLTFAEKPATIF